MEPLLLMHRRSSGDMRMKEMEVAAQIGAQMVQGVAEQREQERRA